MLTKIQMMLSLTIMQSNKWKIIVEFRLFIENRIAYSLKRNINQYAINLEDGNNHKTATCSTVFLFNATSPLMLSPLVKVALKLKHLELLCARSYVEEWTIKILQRTIDCK